MRVVSLILAILVATALYMWVIERDATRAIFSGGMSDGNTGSELTTVASDEETSTAPGDAETKPLITVVARKSVARDIDSAVILRGQTEAARQVDVRAETSATVVSPPLRKGAFVEEHTLLCELDPGTRAAKLLEARAQLIEAKARAAEAESRVPEAKARVKEARARLEEALVNQNAARRLSEGGYAAETRVKNADADHASAEASVEAALSGVTAAESGIQAAAAAIESATASVAAAETELERLKIRAPFAGLLESDTAELGSLLQPGSLCATVIQLDPMKLVAFVPETEVNRIQVGAMAFAQLAAGGSDVQGNVSFLSRSADPTTRTFRIEIEVDNTDLRIRDGQTVEIAISAAGAKAHLLPASALTLNDAGKLGLRTVSEAGVVDFAPVELLRDSAQGVWLAGLPDEINVIVVGQEFVTAGVIVAASFQEQTQ